MNAPDSKRESRFLRREGHAAARPSRVALVLLVLALYVALSIGIYNGLTRDAGGANDFYSRWMGARALLLRRENPYSDAVTREIQIGMYGRVAPPDQDQVAFAYPLYAAYLAAPFVLLPYPIAQALWMALLVIGVVAGALALAMVNGIALKPLALAAIGLSALLFYPSVRGIFLGQYALVSFACIALAGLAIAMGHETTAGILLGVSAVKPQPVILLLPVILFWGWMNRRRRLVWSTAITFAVLIGSSFVLVPTWFGDFLRGLGNYAQYAPVGPPLETFFKLLLPRSLAAIFFYASSAILVAGMGWMVWRSRSHAWDTFQLTLGFVALVTTLIAGRIGTPDQVLLMIPWMAWLAAWCAHKRGLFVAASVILLLFLPWALFLNTLHGNQEAIVVTTAVPLFTLAVFLGMMIMRLRTRGAAQ